MRWVISGNTIQATSSFLQKQNPSYLRYTEHSPGVRMLPSELDWNISALLHTPSSIQPSIPPFNNPPISSHSLRSCHFSNVQRSPQFTHHIYDPLHTSFFSSFFHPFTTIRRSFHTISLPTHVSPFLRLVRRVRKQLTELSLSRMHHHLLYPLSTHT